MLRRLCVALALTACSKAGAPPPSLPPPHVTGADTYATAVGQLVEVTVYGFNLAAGGDASDAPTISYVRVRDLEGNATVGPVLSGKGVASGPQTQGNVAVMYAALGVIRDAGVYALTLRTAAGLEARVEEALVVFPSGEASLDQPVYCQSLGAPIVVHGVFARFGRTQAVVGVMNGGVFMGFPTTLSGCRTIPDSRVSAAVCTRLDATIPERYDVTGHMPLVIATGPGFPVNLDLLVERSMAPWAMNGVALDHPVPVSIGFLPRFAFSPAAFPDVRLDGNRVQAVPSDCSNSGVGTFQLCSQLKFDIPQGTSAGTHLVDATTLGGCTSTGKVTLMPRPQITSVTPASICQWSETPVYVRGTGFAFSAPFLDGGYQPLGSPCTPGGSGDCFDLGPNLHLSSGTHQLIVSNQSVSPPLNSAPASFEVTPGPPLVFDPAPRVVYSGATRKVFVPTDRLTGIPRAAQLLPVSTGSKPIPASLSVVDGGAEVTFAALGGNDYYRVVVADESPCPGMSSSMLEARTDPVIFSRDFETGVKTMDTTYKGGSIGPPGELLPTGGNPGSAFRVIQQTPGDSWYFTLYTGPGLDLGLLKFDLRTSSIDPPDTSPGVILLSGAGFTLERALATPPLSVWTHYELSLDVPDGWTYRDSSGSRPATRLDLRYRLTPRIRGSWSTGTNQTDIDNVLLELAR